MNFLSKMLLIVAAATGLLGFIFDQLTNGSSTMAWVVVVALWVSFAILVEISHRRSLKQAVDIEFRPNSIVVNGTITSFTFSGSERLFETKRLMHEAVEIAAELAMPQDSRRRVFRVGARVRVVPEAKEFQDFEADALDQLVSAHFYAPTFEIVTRNS